MSHPTTLTLLWRANGIGYSDPVSTSSTCADRKHAHSAFQPTGQWITRERRLAIYIRDGFTCLYCTRDLRAVTAAEIHLDHRTPRSAGGTNESGNLFTACRNCNCKRGARSWRAFAAQFAGAEGRIRNALRRKVNLSLARALLSEHAPLELRAAA